MARTGAPETRWYLVSADDDHELTGSACLALLQVIRPRIAALWLDAWTDLALPVEAAAAQAALFARGERDGRTRRSKSYGSAIVLDVSDEEDWALLLAYASWSIHVELESADGKILATLHDCAGSISANLFADEADRYRTALAPSLDLVAARPGLLQRLGRILPT